MVAILKCAGVEKSLLDSNERFYNKLGEEWVWKPVRRREDWDGDRGRGLTLILAGDEIIKLGWTSRRGWEGASGQKLEVSRIESVAPPVSYARVTGRLAPRFAAYLKDEGRLSKGTGQALVEALTKERPDLREAIARISGVSDKYPIGDSPAGQVMALQRDASIVAVRMAGMDVSDFARWDRPTDRLAIDDVPPTFIGRTQGDRQLEERLIQHDAETMLGWLTQKTNHTSWRAFSGFGQRLLVANANNDTAEHTLGVDLIYYNVSRGSMILVQYKKLDAKHNGYFYPDSDGNLAGEIQRMEALNRYVAYSRSPRDDFRLESGPCWIKLCQDQAYIPQTSDMVPGMYFTLDHFQLLRADPRLKGSQGGVRFGYENVPSYLDNTMFTRLVETGLAGTSGIATELVHQQVVESFNGNKALVLAAVFGEDMPQSKRNTEKRNLLRHT
jgi:hypothetical protein